MYASNRYPREGLHIPEHYSGNAFSEPFAVPPADIQEQTETMIASEPAETERVLETEIPPVGEVSDDGTAEVVHAESSNVAEDTANVAAASAGHSGEGGGFSLPFHLFSSSPATLGQEELLILGVLFLLYGGGEIQGREELLFFLVLLLFCG